jgi:hypothetical protein
MEPEAGTVSPSLTPNREIGSGYFFNVFDCNRLSLPILRQKQVQVLCVIFLDLLEGCSNGDQIPGTHFQYHDKNNTQ